MASRNDAFQEFVLSFQSPWNLGGATSHRWSQSFYVSGTITHTQADAETAALALAGPALSLATAATSLVGWSYYPSGSLVSTAQATYAPGTHAGSRAAYSSSSDPVMQLEVAAVAHCPIGKNIRGKEIYLRKYFHDVCSDVANPNSLGILAAPGALLNPFNAGAGPHAVVPVSPTSGKQGGPWTMEGHLFTHQLRKGKKKKKVSASFLEQLVDDATDLSALKTLVKAAQG